MKSRKRKPTKKDKIELMKNPYLRNKPYYYYDFEINEADRTIAFKRNKVSLPANAFSIGSISMRKTKYGWAGFIAANSKKQALEIFRRELPGFI